MKNLLFGAALAVFAFTNVNAQEVKFGIKAGVNLASISGDDTDDVDGRTSFHVGGLAEIMISEKFSVQPELLYSSQGATSEYSDNFEGFSYSVEEKLKLDYLNIPILAKYYVAEGFSIEAGPQIGILLSAKAEVEETEDGDSASYEEDIKDGFKSIDLGLGIGAGYKMDSGLNFALRYVFGLSNIADGEGSEDYSIQNSVLQLSLGFTF